MAAGVEKTKQKKLAKRKLKWLKPISFPFSGRAYIEKVFKLPHINQHLNWSALQQIEKESNLQ